MLNSFRIGMLCTSLLSTECLRHFCRVSNPPFLDPLSIASSLNSKFKGQLSNVYGLTVPISYTECYSYCVPVGVCCPNHVGPLISIYCILTTFKDSGHIPATRRELSFSSCAWNNPTDIPRHLRRHNLEIMLYSGLG